MGSSLSSSTSSVDEFMNKNIFLPPQTPKERFKRLHGLKYTQDQDNNKIYFYQFDPVGNKKQYIIFSHGNGADIYHMYSYYRDLANYLKIGIIGYDYHGYGLSEGESNEENCYKAMNAVVKYCTDTLGINKNDLFLMGQSLGTGVTVDYASKNNWETPIFLISPYKTIAKVVIDSSITKPIDKFESLPKMKKINCPVKIYHGESDELIGIHHGEAIWDNVKNKKYKPTWIPDTGHNDILEKIDYEEIKKIIDEC